jgi:cell wall-associated NlpC family hydrolase
MKIVIRPKYSYLDIQRLFEWSEKMLFTEYTIGAKNHEAPKKTDCITAVRWILRLSSDFLLPTAYIGDLPKILIDEYNCTIHSLQLAQAGDLIFFEKYSKRHQSYMVTHIGCMISADEFIHSSLQYHGKISRIDDEGYIDSILEDNFISGSWDPRSNSIWKKHSS